MSGAFQTSRDIFNSPIWKNIVDFRLFFLIYGSAVFSEDGVRLAEDLTLKRGEWCRSIRKIQEDLQYIENRQVKTYSTSVISRCIKRLEGMQMVCTRKHELGTVFTVVNYEQYQGLSNYKKDNLERDLEHSGNSGGTLGEHSGNNNKNVKKEKNANKDKEIKKAYAENVQLTESEYQRLVDEYGKELTDRSVEYLSSYKVEKSYKTKSDNLTIRRWVIDAAKKVAVIQPAKRVGENNVEHGGRNQAVKTTGNAATRIGTQQSESRFPKGKWDDVDVSLPAVQG